MLNVPAESVCVILVRGSGCYGLNGADAVSFDAAILSQAVGRPVRLQFSRQDEMMWENLGAACVVEHGAALASDGSVAAWDRENCVASLGNRPAMTAPETSDSGPERYVTSGMLAGYEPDPFKAVYQIDEESAPEVLTGYLNGLGVVAGLRRKCNPI